MANNYFGIYVNPPPHTLMLQIQLFRNKTFFSLFVCRCGWKLGHHRSPFFLYQSFNRKWHTIISNYFHLNNPQNRTGGLGCFVHIRRKKYLPCSAWVRSRVMRNERSFIFATRWKEILFLHWTAKQIPIPFMVLVIPKWKKQQMVLCGQPHVQH